MIDRIKHKGKEVAILIRHGHEVEQAEFLTSLDEPMQVGLLNRSAGQIAPAHRHIFPETKVNSLYEFIYVVKGHLRMNIYDERTEKLIYQTDMIAGDAILHKAQAHGVEFLEETLIYEVKQGPYPGDKHAKVYLKKPI